MLICIGIVIYLLIGTGILPETKVITGKDISDYQLRQLISNKVISENDKIFCFYSEGVLSVLEGGQLLTDNQITSYFTDENNQLDIRKMKYKNIRSVELMQQGSYFVDSVYEVFGNKNAEKGSIILYLSSEAKGDLKFIEKLEEFIK